MDCGACMESQTEEVGGVLLLILDPFTLATGVPDRLTPYAVLARESGRGGDNVWPFGYLATAAVLVLATSASKRATRVSSVET
jgi:hypothetical protein